MYINTVSCSTLGIHNNRVSYSTSHSLNSDGKRILEGSKPDFAQEGEGGVSTNRTVFKPDSLDVNCVFLYIFGLLAFMWKLLSANFADAQPY